MNGPPSSSRLSSGKSARRALPVGVAEDGGGVFGFYGVVMDTSSVTGVTAHVAGA